MVFPNRPWVSDLGILTLQPGDSVYIIKGALVPYILRSISENPADGFKLVREAYVNGIMYGEALSAGPSTSIGWRSIGKILQWLHSLREWNIA
jgi:hypothetical protein